MRPKEKEKPKRKDKPVRQPQWPYIVFFLVIVLVVARYIIDDSPYQPSDTEVHVIYPLFIALQDPLLLIVCSFLLPAAVLALKGKPQIVAFVSMFVLWFYLFSLLFFSDMAGTRATATYQDHVYYILESVSWDIDYDHDYALYQCDATGIWCQFVSHIPQSYYLKDISFHTDESNDSFYVDIDGSIFVIDENGIILDSGQASQGDE